MQTRKLNEPRRPDSPRRSASDRRSRGHGATPKAALLACSWGAMVASGGAADVRQDFRSPPTGSRPMVRWWWPGGDVTDAELRREVQLLDEAGFGGAEIQPFNIGLGSAASPKVHDFLTPTFWGHVQSALAEAHQRGLWLDLTFGSGWPFGGAHIALDKATAELRFTHKTVRGPVRFVDQVDRPEFLKHWERDAIDEVLGWRRPSEEERAAMRARQKVVAVVAMRGTATEAKEVGPPPRFGQQRYRVEKSGRLDPASAVVLTDRLDADGRLTWDVPAGEWQLFVFAQNPADKTVLGGVGGHPQRVLDHLNRAAMHAHLQAVGGSAQQHVGKYFGRGLRAIFCDSLEVEANLFWTDSLLEEFRRRRGYDLVPWLPFLKQPGRGENYTTYPSLPFYEDAHGEAEGVRHDFWLTVSDLLMDNFYGPFCDWARRHGLLARVQAHGAQGDVMGIYGLADIPETETLAHHGRPEFLRMAASVARQGGRGLAAAECFVHPGNPFSTTPESMKHEADRLFLAGINQLIYHGYSYDTITPTGAPWHPFVAPLPFTSALNQRNPFWRFLRPFNTYVARMQMLLQSGRAEVPVAIFDPDLSCEDSERLGTFNQREELQRRLMAAGYASDRIGGGELVAAKARDGRLVTRGGTSYGGLMVLGRDRIAIEQAEALATLALGKVPLVFLGRTPSAEAGYRDQQNRTRRIQALLGGMSPWADSAAAVAFIASRVAPNLRFAAPATEVAFLETRIGKLTLFMLRNEATTARQLEVSFPSRIPPERWDAWTGVVSAATDFALTEHGVRMRLSLAPKETCLIGFDPRSRHSPVATTTGEVTPDSLPIAGPWVLNAGGVTRSVTALFDWATDAELRSFSGGAKYSAQFPVPAGLIGAGRRLVLQLGEVKDVAEVRLNGRDLPPLLFSPYDVDVTDLIQPGSNRIEVQVTNTPTNEQLARGSDLAGLYKAAASKTPMRSGLLGPVSIKSVIGPPASEMR